MEEEITNSRNAWICGIYDMNFSKVTPNLCAVAVGDRTIRVWDTSDENDFRRSTTHWSGLQSEVTCVCWHPTNDGLLHMAQLMVALAY